MHRGGCTRLFDAHNLLASLAEPCYSARPTGKRTMSPKTKTYLPAANMLDRQVEGANARARRG